MKSTLTNCALAALVAISSLAPRSAEAGPPRKRQETKNEWRNIAIGSGIVGLLGLVKNDGTLTFVGTAGALYTAWRYEQDRKSQNRQRRARAQIFSRRSFVRDGHRYERRTVVKNGKKYYQFCRVS